MEEKLDFVVDDAARLAESLFGGYVGDMLNPVNACTAVTVYFPEHHPIFDTLATLVSASPPGAATDLEFDVLLRFSALALLGKTHVDSSDDKVIRSLLRRLEPSRHVGGQIGVDYLLNVWRRNRDFFCANQFSTFLFGQYVGRLVSRCGIDVPPDERHTIVDQIDRRVPELLGSLGQRQISLVALPLIESQLLLGANATTLLGEIDAARTLVEYALKIHEPLSRELNAPQGEGLALALAEQVFDSLCFVGLNAYYLEPWFGTESQKMQDLVWRCLVPTLGTDDYDASGLRRISLRLAGVRCIVPDHLSRKVAAEFIAVSELDTFRQIREFLRDTDSWTSWREDLKASGLDTDAITPQALHDLINRIKFTPLAYVRSPKETLMAAEGDCKSIATLAASVLLKAGIRGSLCLFFGQDVSLYRGSSVPLANHVFVEWIDRDTGKGIPIDNGVTFGQLQPFIEDERHVVRYPIHTLVVESDEEQMFASLAFDRARVRSLLRRKHT